MGVAFAGINSSTADQAAGKNEHLRSFELRYPPTKKINPDAVATLNEQALESKSATKALGQASVFTPSSATKKETYQRVLRLSRPSNGDKHRLGAIATGLAPEGEIVAFDASKKSPTVDDVWCRISLGKGQEAGDVDIVDVQDSGYYLAYCTDYDVYITKVSPFERQDPETILIHSTPHPDVFASTKARPKFRSLRFLSRTLLLLLQNRPNRTGADVLVLEIPSPPSLGKVVLRKRLHRSIKTATALSVSLLPSASASDNVQHVIGIAGQDNSITILTLDQPPNPPFPSLKCRTYTLLHNVHALQITAITFSIFQPPTDLPTAPPQYLKLASTSIASTVTVHTLPLKPYPEATPNRRPRRYVLTTPGRSEASQITFSVLISALVIALGAFLLQAFTEIRGGTPEYLGAKGWLSERVHGWIARPYMFEDAAEKLSVPGVKTRPTYSMKSQAAEITGAVQRKGQEVERQVEQVVDQGNQAVKQAEAKAEEVISQVNKGAKAAREKLSLRDLLSRRASSQNPDTPSEQKPHAIVVAHDEDSKALSADTRDPETVIGETHKRWEELEQHERETWKRRLIEAGEWAVDEGEAVLKGVFFQNIALAVGAAVRAGM